MDLFVAGRDQLAADQPDNLAEGHPPRTVTIVIHGVIFLFICQYAGTIDSEIATNLDN
jgi:hypothetical protein